jgi:hypothetical protein
VAVVTGAPTSKLDRVQLRLQPSWQSPRCTYSRTNERQLGGADRRHEVPKGKPFQGDVASEATRGFRNCPADEGAPSIDFRDRPLSRSPMSGAPTVLEQRGHAILGILGVLTGVLIVGSIVASTFEPSPTPLNALSTYLNNVNLYWIVFGLTAAAVSVGIPFFAGTGRLLSPRSPVIASAAAITIVAGILVAVLGSLLSVGAYWAITQAPAGTNSSNAVFEAAFWDNFSGIFSIFGFFLAGVGFILFGWLGWRSRIMPDWLAIIGFIGGIAGLLASVTFFGFIIILAAFAIWGFVIGGRLLMTPRRMAASPTSGG